MEKTLYERYGNNEPYTEPDANSEDGYYSSAKKQNTFFHLITGPSTNFYIGPEKAHYTIPKRLLYESCDFAKPCLEGNFAEAETNAIWLPDVSPDVFQWIWKWLYQGQLGIERYCYTVRSDEEGLWFDDEDLWCVYSPVAHRRACQLLCRVHMLGERLLFDHRFLGDVVREELQTLIERAKGNDYLNPFTPEIIEEVLSRSEPLESFHGWVTTLRAFLLQQLRDYEFCAKLDFMKCSRCFELDGAFAAELMMFMARELEWARELWGAQTESMVDIVEKKLRLAEVEGNLKALVNGPKRRSDLWLALRYLCTFQGCTTTNFRHFNNCFELDGLFAAEILAYMAGELLWIREKWGEERGPKVNIAQEKETEEWNEQDQDDIERLVNRNRFR